MKKLVFSIVLLILAFLLAHLYLLFFDNDADFSAETVKIENQNQVNNPV